MDRRALFVFDRDGWCSVFPDAAAHDLEAADVEAGEYVAFGQDGTVIEVLGEGLDVHLRPTADRDRADLHRRLRRFLDEAGIECAGDDVVDIGNAILKADWESRRPKRPRWLSRRIHGDGPQTL